MTWRGVTMPLLEKRPSESPREVCRAVILIVRRSALVKVDSPRAIDRCIEFFGESTERHALCMIDSAGRVRPSFLTPDDHWADCPRCLGNWGRHT